MHEFSLAEALLGQVEAHTPRGAVIRGVAVRIGPLQMVDPDALALAWGAVTAGTRADGGVLRTEFTPPQRLCPDCGRRWTGGALIEPCTCGHPRPGWIDGDALTLVSIDAEFADTPAVAPRRHNPQGPEP